MNILHLLPYWTTGGVEEFVSDLSAFSVYFHYVRADKKLSPFPEAVREWRGESIDVLHYHHAMPVNVVPDRKDIRKACRVFTVHNHYEDKPFIGSPHYTVAVSESAAEAIRGHGIGVDTIIPPSINLNTFSGGYDGVDPWLRHLGLEHNEAPVIMWAGRICPGKRPELLAEIIEANPQYRWIVVGDDYLAGGMGSVPEKVRNVIERHPSVSHLSYVPRHDMPKLYRIADVFLSTSRREGFGLTVVEAMACRTPVVVPDVPALNEIVGHGEFGQCINSLSGEKFSEAIEESLANTFEWQQRGVERVRQLGVDAIKVARQYDTIYEAKQALTGGLTHGMDD